MDDGQHDEAARVAELDRVLLRLGLTDDDKLCDVLRLLLPQLFQRLIETGAASVTAKILDIFAHLIKRLKTFPSMRVVLPLASLLAYLDPTEHLVQTNAAYARNFTVLFLELGFPAQPEDEKTAILSALVSGLAAKSASVQDTFFRLLLHSFRFQTSTPIRVPASTDDVLVLLDYLLDVLLCPVISTARSERLQRTKLLSLEKASRTDIQLQVVQFLKGVIAGSDGVNVALWYLHFAVGATAEFHTISTYCREELDRLHKYQLDVLDNAAAMSLFARSLLGQSAPSELGGILLNDRPPLPEAVALHILPLLGLSKAAANIFPMNLQLICTLLFGNVTAKALTQPIRKAGIDFCVWTLSHSDEAMVVAALGPVLYTPLMKLQQDQDCSPSVRHGVYSSLSILATRCPAVIAASAEPFQHLMYRAMREEDESRSGSVCLEALKTLCTAYTSGLVPSAVLATIKREIHELSDATSVMQPKFDRVRGILAFWASQLLFSNATESPGGDLHLRRVLLRFAGDASDQVREICAAAMMKTPLPPFASVVSVCSPASMLTPTSSEVVLRSTLQFYLACLAANDVAGLMPSDVHALVEACMGLIGAGGSPAFVASEALVQLADLPAARPFLHEQLRTLVAILLSVENTEIREHLAITIGSLDLPEIDAHGLAMELQAHIASDHWPERHGALSGVSMLARSLRNLDEGIASRVLVLLQRTLEPLLLGHASVLSAHDAKLQYAHAFACTQVLGALAAAHSVANLPLTLAVLLDVLKLPSKDPDMAETIDRLHLRALQSLACLFYHNDEAAALVDDTASALVTAYSDRKDVSFQYGIGQLFVAMGHGRDAPLSSLVSQVTTLLSSPSPHLKASGALYLFCILLAATSDGPWRELIQCPGTATSIHDRAIDLLNEANAFTQECAVKSLTLLYTLASAPDELSDTLFKRLKCYRAFLNAPAATAPTPTADDVTSAANAIENACYREVSTVAAEVGDPSVMYTLLYLCTSDPTWGGLRAPVAVGVSRFIAAPLQLDVLHTAFSKSQIERAQVTWHASAVASRLVPRLFLLKAHPNPKISGCMLQLWTLLKSTKPDLVHDYYDVLMAHVLGRTTSKNFKYREASCAALVELLQGRTSGQVAAYLRDLWKATARAVDDVNESVVIASIKLVKCVGELSVRVATADATCVDAVLPFLVDEGIVSSNKLCQGLCMGYLLRLVQQLPPHHLQAHLSTLPITLLACMSSLEMPELQYAQFHVQDKRQLEKLRVSLSQAGPVGELLTACLTQLSQLARNHSAIVSGIVGTLCTGVCTTLRSGVGLNTRVGAANFVVSLVSDVPHEMRSSGGAEKLLKSIFTPYMAHMVLTEARDGSNENDGPEATAQEDGLRDGLVVRAYGRAAAYVAKLVPTHFVDAYVSQALLAVPTSIVFATDAGSTTTTGLGRYGWVTATAAADLLRQLPPTRERSATDTDDDWCQRVFPVAFAGQFANSTGLGAAWATVLECIPPTLSYSSRYVTTALAYATTLVGHLLGKRASKAHSH
ncbi:hypothetical protein SPRG_01752 [Saprolegnia parasitica CBS 223.65]|uniref:DUF3730 domain-containing protein n=1 Tax=Saprolegnia parasitica (strain CBS 223.65) TaxID=695850 RepID=A0A067D4C3_SAPPC|nr:hypothetical protein SPRG_01752 [Saprolegnia parasitica CBS 223.65]KDO33872.1 hypothetical protein SPRG_01752 [Saprolegnia parasitica CBS 223.65]|eukprot:XP_012195508.1 hypothetical protein SPRG_01752 [Saprolegnia parasitica CBS 223.65]